MTKCVIFDLDGTFSITDHRQHFLERNPKDWQSFFDACVHDPVRQEVLDLWNLLDDRVSRVIVSGRPSSHREQTILWLDDLGVTPDDLIMREEGNLEPDHEFKLRVLNHLRTLDMQILFSVDDRPRVVQMWRENGVPCFTVDQSHWEGKE